MPLPSPVALNHAMIYSRDVAASARFYETALGLRPLELQLPFYARLKAPRGTSTIAVHQVEPGVDLHPGAIRLYFETPDVKAAVARVKRAGYSVKTAPKKMPWGWTHAYLDDPDGHEISLYWSGGARTRRAAG